MSSRIIYAVIACMLLCSCSSDGAIQEEKLVPNLEILASSCYSLCGVDETAYCVEELTLVFTSELYTTGNCRVFSKYVSGFEKCEGFCKHYGNEKGCHVDGVKDSNCDGVV